MKTTKNKQAYENSIISTKTKPSAHSIVLPESLQEIQNLIKTTTLDIIPRGAGINFSGSTIPNNSIILDTSKMNKILELDTNRKTVTIEPGVTIQQINNHLEKHNLEFPVKPMFQNLRTLGGLISTNSSGAREIKYGKIKNWIESLEVINGKADQLTMSRSDLNEFAGMEGATGVITKIKLKLTTKKLRSLSIFKTNDLGEAINLSRKMKLDQEISMVYILDNTLSLLSRFEKKYHIFVEFENNQGTFKQQAYEKLINLLDNLYYILANNGYTLLENPKFFLDGLEEFLLYLEEHHIPYFADLASGSVFYAMKPKEQEKHQEILKKTKRLRGILAYNFGIGITKKQFLEKNEKILISRIKLRQDPNLKFNQNKLIDVEYLEEIKQQLEQQPTPTSKKPNRSNNLPDNLPDSSINIPNKVQKQPEPKVELLDELKTPEEKLEEFINEQEIKDELEEVLEAKPIDQNNTSDGLQTPKTLSKSEQYTSNNLQIPFEPLIKSPIKILEKSQNNPEDYLDLSNKEKELNTLHDLIKQNKTIQSPKKELSKEEQEKIKKIAGGFLG